MLDQPSKDDTCLALPVPLISGCDGICLTELTEEAVVSTMSTPYGEEGPYAICCYILFEGG